MSRHYLIRNEHNVELLSRTMVPRATLKRIFGAYKKIDTQEQSEPVLTKKKTLAKNTENK